MTVPNITALSDADQVEHYEATDLGNGRRLVTLAGEDFRYVPEWGRWLCWDGRRWARDMTGEITRQAKAVTEAILDEARANQDDKLFKWGIRSQSAGKIAAAVELATTERSIPILAEQLDRDPWLLCVANGTINLRTGQLQPHRRADLITRATQVNWDPDATCPVFDTFLERVIADPDVRAFLQRFFGYCLTGDVSEQVLVICHGSGSNGKSTLMTVLEEMLGEHAGPASPRLLVDEKHGEHPTQIADLHGKRLIVAQEVQQGHRLDEELVKVLTGGDRLKARFMRQDYWSFTPTHKLMLCTNHKPRIAGTDHAIWRRIRLIPFDVVIPDHEQDKALGDKLRAELPGILRWTVAGCRNWQDRGLQPPQAVVAATDEYRVEMDLVAQFLADTCTTNAMMQVRSTDLYNAYKEWCQANGLTHPLSQKALAPRLEERGFDRTEDRTKRIWWTGLGLINGSAQDEETTL